MKAPKYIMRPLAIAALSAAVATGALAQSAAKGSGDTGSATVAGQKVAIDPHTGRLRPLTPQESRRLGQAMHQMVNRSTEGLNVVQHPNGMKSVDLQGRFQSLAVARKNADGSVSEGCVTNNSEAQRFMKSKAKQTTKRSAISEVK